MAKRTAAGECAKKKIRGGGKEKRRATTASGEEESGRRVRNRNHGILVALKNESRAVFYETKIAINQP